MFDVAWHCRCLFSSLGLSGKTVTYKRSTVDTECLTTSTKVVNFISYSLDDSKSRTMSNVFVVEEVPYTYYPCNDLSAYPHLSDIPISPVHPPAKVDLLIDKITVKVLFLCRFSNVTLAILSLF